MNRQSIGPPWPSSRTISEMVRTGTACGPETSLHLAGTRTIQRRNQAAELASDPVDDLGALALVLVLRDEAVPAELLELQENRSNVGT